VEPKSRRIWIWLAAGIGFAVFLFFAVKTTEARRDAIRGGRPNQVDFSR